MVPVGDEQILDRKDLATCFVLLAQLVIPVPFDTPIGDVNSRNRVGEDTCIPFHVVTVLPDHGAPPANSKMTA